MLIDPDLSRELLEAQLNTDSTLAEKTKKVCLALYDLTNRNKDSLEVPKKHKELLIR